MKRKILKKILFFITKLVIKKYNPKIIGITGSVGKTSTKNAVFLLLNNFYKTKSSVGNLNTEFGLPLVFIGIDKGGENSFIEWFKIIIKGIKIILFKEINYPEIIIAEMGADKPGDISYLTQLAKPNIGLITYIGEAPSHLEFYKNIDQLINEKSKIIQVLNNNDFGILNIDDPKINKLKDKFLSKIFTFGFDKNADVQISDFEYNNGSVFNITFKKEIIKINLKYCLGKPFAYSVAAAVCCGLAIGIKLREMINSFDNLKPAPGRMNMLAGIKEFFVIDDTYNASPASVKSALEVLNQLSANRKISVLGDMKELGEISKKEHLEIGRLASTISSLIFIVGEQAKYIKQGAINNGFDKSKIYHFENSNEASIAVENIVKSGDLILIKGSRSMKMEKIVKRIVK